MPVAAVTAADLGDPPTATATGWPRPAAPLVVAVDPVRGRLAFRDGAAPHAGRGHRDRRHRPAGSARGPTCATRPADRARRRASRGSARSAGRADPVPGVVCATLAEALTDWQAAPSGTIGVIAVVDSRTYVEDLAVTVAERQRADDRGHWRGRRPRPRRADRPGPRPTPSRAGRRPHLLGSLTVTGAASATGTAARRAHPGRAARGGQRHRGPRRPGAPGAAPHHASSPAPGSLSVDAPTTADDDNGHLVIELTRAVTGSLAVPRRGPELDLPSRASWTASAAPRSTPPEVPGPARPGHGPRRPRRRAAQRERLRARRPGHGGAAPGGLPALQPPQRGRRRAAPLPLPARPRAHRRHRTRPRRPPSAPASRRAFSSTTYGDPAYGQLDDRSDPALLTGASDGAAMGAFAELEEPAAAGEPRCRARRAPAPRPRGGSHP